jgi:hypothetical protein
MEIAIFLVLAKNAVAKDIYNTIKKTKLREKNFVENIAKQKDKKTNCIIIPATSLK